MFAGKLSPAFDQLSDKQDFHSTSVDHKEPVGAVLHLKRARDVWVSGQTEPETKYMGEIG
jgi:hypothetical protein